MKEVTLSYSNNILDLSQKIVYFYDQNKFKIVQIYVHNL